VATGNPVALVSVAADGVPRFGVVSTGEVRVLFVSVCVAVSVSTVSVIAGNVMEKLEAPALALRNDVTPVEDPSSRKVLAAAVSVAPVLSDMAAVLLAPEVMALKALDPPPPCPATLQLEPLLTMRP